jgi:protein SCO1
MKVAAVQFLIVVLALTSLARAGDFAPPAAPMSPSTQPAILNDVGIDQKLGVQVPLDLVFRDENGKEVKLGDYFGKSQRPIILTLVYYKCPMLCTMVLNELVRTMNGMSTMTAGKDFDVLTVSFDPKETPELAAAKRKQYLHEYGKRGDLGGWHFLVGSENSIKKLTDAVGFRYTWDPKYQQYVHASGLMILTPDGHVARYFYGLDYAVKDVRLSLVEASDNKVGTPVEQIMLYCFHYDPSTGKYSVAVTNLLKVAATITLLALGGFVWVNLRRERNQRLATTAATPPQVSS